MAENIEKTPVGRRRGLALTVGIALLLLALVPILTLGLRKRAASSPEGSPSPSTTPHTSVDEVHRGSIKRMHVLDGDLRAVRSRTVYAISSDEAKIVFLPPEGTVVKAGQRVVELDSTTLLTRIKDNEDRVIASDSEIVRTAAQHESALRDMQVELSKLELA